MKLIDKLKYFVVKNYIFIIISLIYLILRLPYLLTNAFAPDEYFYYKIGMGSFTIYNKFSLGAIFWEIGWIVGKISFGYGLFTLRILSALFTIFGCFYFYKVVKLYVKDLLFLTVFTISLFSISFFWFNGKIVTPELYLMYPLCYLFYRAIINNKLNKYEYILLGLCVGIKLTALPFAVAIYLYIFLYKIDIKKIVKTIPFLVLGFIISSINIIVNPSSYLKILSSNTGVGHRLIHRFDLLFTLKSYYNHNLITNSWDYVPSHGMDLMLPLFSIGIILFLIFLNNKKTFITAVIAIFLLFLIISSNGRYLFIWYIFTLIPILMGLYISTLKSNKFVKLNLILLIIFSVYNYYTISTFYFKYSNIRSTFSSDIKLNKSTATCIIRAIKRRDIPLYALATYRYPIHDYKGQGLYFISKLRKNNIKIEFILKFNNEKEFYILYHKYRKRFYDMPKYMQYSTMTTKCNNIIIKKINLNRGKK